MSSPRTKKNRKYSTFHVGQISGTSFAHPGPPEGRFAIVTMRWAGDAMDALASGVFFAPDENAKAYGEVVWSWRRDAGVKLCGIFRKVTVAKKPAHRGELEVSRKAIARGRPGCFG
jgi:hypothetical protein